MEEEREAKLASEVLHVITRLDDLLWRYYGDKLIGLHLDDLDQDCESPSFDEDPLLDTDSEYV